MDPKTVAPPKTDPAPDPKVVAPPTPPLKEAQPGDQTVSLLDGADGAKKLDPPKPDDKTKAPDDTKTVVPDKYTLAIPKDSLLGEADLPRIEALARTRGLTQEQAQAFIEAQSELLSDDAKVEKERFSKVQKEWVDTVRNDPVLGNANLPVSMEAVKRFVEDPKKFPADLKKLLVDSGLHNHPSVFRFLHGLAVEGKNDRMVVPPNNGAPSDAKAKILSPDQRMEAMYAQRHAAEKAKTNVVNQSE